MRGLAVRGVGAQKKEWSEKCMEETWQEIFEFQSQEISIFKMLDTLVYL